MKVYVVMSNDFPDSVFMNRRKADAYVKKWKKIKALKFRDFQRIYWQVYEFEVQQ